MEDFSLWFYARFISRSLDHVKAVINNSFLSRSTTQQIYITPNTRTHLNPKSIRTWHKQTRKFRVSLIVPETCLPENQNIQPRCWYDAHRCCQICYHSWILCLYCFCESWNCLSVANLSNKPVLLNCPSMFEVSRLDNLSDKNNDKHH